MRSIKISILCTNYSVLIFPPDKIIYFLANRYHCILGNITEISFREWHCLCPEPIKFLSRYNRYEEVNCNFCCPAVTC